MLALLCILVIYAAAYFSVRPGFERTHVRITAVNNGVLGWRRVEAFYFDLSDPSAKYTLYTFYPALIVDSWITGTGRKVEGVKN